MDASRPPIDLAAGGLLSPTLVRAVLDAGGLAPVEFGGVATAENKSGLAPAAVDVEGGLVVLSWAVTGEGEATTTKQCKL